MVDVGVTAITLRSVRLPELLETGRLIPGLAHSPSDMGIEEATDKVMTGWWRLL